LAQAQGGFNPDLYLFYIYSIMKLLKPLIAVLMLGSASSSANPISKVITMISRLEQSIIKEGDESQKIYTEFAEMCEDRSRELHHDIKQSKRKSTELAATMEKAIADEVVFDEKINDKADGSSDAEDEVKKAGALRAKESSDFKVVEAELQKTISSIERSITVIEREGPGASAIQLDAAHSITQVLQTMSEAEAIDSDDAATLTSLMQSSDSEGDEETGAPSAASYKGQSGQIVETLMGLLEKTQKQLQNARNGETNSVNGYQMLRQSLDAKIKTMNKEMGEAKKSKAATGETQAVAKGNLDMTKKDLSQDEKELAELHHECLDQANSFEEGMASRGEELKALAEAKKIISSTSGGATKQTYALAQASFVQVASKSQSSGSSALHIVRKIAITYKSSAFMELANHIEKAIRYGGLSGASPFSKVKSMLDSMIDKLQKEAESAATKKDYCDKEMGETTSNLDDKELQIERLTTQLEVMSAASKTLRSEVGGLQKQLGEMAGTQAEMNKLRMEEKTTYNENRPVLEQGLEGIKSALTVLRDYYAQDKDSSSGSGAATGIIGMLEVVESDFSKGIAAMISSEESAASEYATATNENKVAAATKRQDVKYKTAEYVSLDKSISESQSDRSGVNSELAAVQQYFAGIKKECVAAPSSYEERKKRRESELGGLKEALESMGEASSFLQTGSQHRTLRGVATHTQSSD